MRELGRKLNILTHWLCIVGIIMGVLIIFMEWKLIKYDKAEYLRYTPGRTYQLQTDGFYEYRLSKDGINWSEWIEFTDDDIQENRIALLEKWVNKGDMYMQTRITGIRIR
jgi:hypothetical protein